MEVSTLSYLALSRLSWDDLQYTQAHKNQTIAQLIQGGVYGGIGSELLSILNNASGATDFSGWTLVDFTSDYASGFGGAVFKTPDGQLVFSFRGTNFSTLEDILTDSDIITPMASPGYPQQFEDAFDWVMDILANNTYSGYSFTGHSLGGGIASYMTYATNEVGHAITFNAVNIAQVIATEDSNFNAGNYNDSITDYVNENDLVGMLGEQMGTTVFIKDGSQYAHDLNTVRVSYLSFSQQAMNMGLMSPVIAVPTIRQTTLNLNSTSLQIANDFVNDPLDVSIHDLKSFLKQSPGGGYALNDGALDSNVSVLASALYGLAKTSNFVVGGGGTMLGAGLYAVANAYVDTFYNTSKAVGTGIIKIGDGVGAGLYYVGTTLNQASANANDAIEEAAWNIYNYFRWLKTGEIQTYNNSFAMGNAANTRPIDPLILDLDGDGIETANVDNSTAFFDLDNNGFAENTGWVGEDDGLLVLDRNNDGIVNNGGELFGDRTLLVDGNTYASSGFEALAELDGNQDGIINANDSIYSLLRVWQDANGDGSSAASELKTLLELGIVSIGLQYLNTGVTDTSNNIQVRVGEFQYDDGTVNNVGEYLFRRNAANSVDQTPLVDVPVDIAVLPDLQGAGNVPSLHKAMMDDSSGELKGLVESFIAETDPAIRKSLIQQILIKWTNSDAIDSTSRGPNFDAQKLAVMEKFFGTTFSGNPNIAAVSFLDTAFDGLAENIYVTLSAATHLSNIVAALEMNEDGSISYTDIILTIDSTLVANHAEGVELLKEFSRVAKHYKLDDLGGYSDFRGHYAVQSEEYAKAIDFAGTQPIVGTTGDDSLSTSGNQSALDGGAGDDYLYANTTSNIALYGGAGNDSLHGSVGNDILNGGTGNDNLNGGTGNDTYMFGRGYGVDTIIDRDAAERNVDTIRFMDDVASEDVIVRRVGNNLELSIMGTGDKLIIEQYFSRYYYSGYYSYDVGENGNKVEQIVFNDGTIWSIADVKEKARDIVGTEGDESLTGYNDQDDRVIALAGSDYVSTGDGNDVINAGAGNDTVYAGTGSDSLVGGDGNDTLYGNEGNDTLDGGAGVDKLEGGLGNDIYVFGTGYGVDTISDPDSTAENQDVVQFTASVAPSNVLVKRSGDSLELQISGTDDKLVIERYFTRWYYSGYSSYDMGENGNKVELVTFADGTVWTIADVKEKARTLVGTSGADSMSGFYDQANIISGLEGDDYLYGNVQADQLLGGADNDTLYGYSGNDTLDGGTGTDRLEGADGNDTYVFGLGYGIDTIYDSDNTAGNVDAINFSEEILPSNITVKRNGSNLELVVNEFDKVIIENYFSAYNRNGYYVGEGSNRVEEVRFADGTIWDVATIKDKARTITGTASSDYLSGYGDQQNIISGLEGNDTLYAGGLGDHLAGGSGNDELFGSSGADVLTGGTGNDRLEGSSGNDGYIFNLGDGVDTIYDSDSTVDNLDKITFQANIAPEDVAVKRNGDNLELSILGTSDKLVVEKYFSAYNRNGYYIGTNAHTIEQIVFADGTTWGIADVKEKARYVSGTSGDDYIYGFSDQQNIITADEGNDTVYAGGLGDHLDGGAGNDSLFGSSGTDTFVSSTGNDTLEGNAGNDTYTFSLGLGNDTIYDIDNTAGNTDTIQFLEGINPEDVVATRSGDDLVLRITGTSDSLTVDQYFSQYTRNGYNAGGPDAQKVEIIQFANGTTWSVADIKDKVRHISGTSNGETIYGFSDQQNIISAGAGDDTIYAGGANSDKLYGEAGSDNLYGSYSNETLDGGTGNDILEGSTGNDTYVFGLGYGTDTIYDNDTTQGNQDTIQFLAGIAPEDVSVKRNGDNLELSIANTTDKLIVQNYFSGYYRNSSYYAGENANKTETISFANGATWDVATILDKARYVTGTENSETLYAFSSNDIISALAGDDTIYAGYGDDVVNGGDGNDILHGESGNNQLLGDAGNDSLYGAQGTDMLNGGAGNDILEGSTGNDTYLFASGFGVDTIYDNDSGQGNSLDAVEFAAGIASEDVVVRRLSNGDLGLSLIGTSDKLTIQQFFSNYYRNSSWNTGANSNAIEEIRFADGTTWDIADIKDKARFIKGTSSDDYINGFGDQQNVITAGDGNDTVYAASSLNDELYGEAGNDTLAGTWNNDRFDGGTGNDYLEGSAGDDTYVFGPGYGQDVIYDSSQGQTGGLDKVTFLEGINPADVIVKRMQNGDLELTFAGSTDKLTIERYFSSYYKNSSWNTGLDSNVVEEFRFADGTVWNVATIKDKVRTINGTENSDSLQGFGDQQNLLYAGAGDDTIYAGGVNGDKLYGEAENDTLVGSWSSETLDGGTGNDYLEASAGDDTYIFGLGYGQDVIYDSNQGQTGGVDKVTFAAGINPADLSLKRLPNSDLEITFVGTADKLTIERYFSPYYKNSSWNAGTDSNVVEEFRFADGTVWNTATIKDKVRTMHGTENSETLQGFSDQQNLLYASAGDDTVYAGGMSGDELYGEAGNDTLVGSWSSEKLDGGTGNDYLEGSAGNDTYVFGPGYGQDVIYDSNQGQGSGLDKVTFLSGINPADVTAKRLPNSDLELTFANSTDKLTIERYFNPYYKNSSWNAGTDSNVIEEFHFADNTIWSADTIKTMVRTINGTENNDTLQGYENADTISAGAGDDTVYAGYANDVMSGNTGNDTLYGEDGNDLIDGGTGSDTLDGGYGDDTYVFSGAFGSDQINDYYGNDLVQFNDLNKDGIMFGQVGNTLQITSAGISDSVSIASWYSYNDYKIETIKSSDGSTISSTQVEQLIQAMASWSVNNNGMSWSQALSSNPQDVQAIVSQYWTAPTV